MAARPARWTTPARRSLGRTDRVQCATLSFAMIQKSLLHKGCRLSYFIEGHGPPVILVQGTAVSGGAWRPQLDALAQHFRCLWFDNRGYGKSLPLTPSLTVPQMGEDVLALMDAEEFATAHLIGHSLGGLIALSAASQARSRVLSLSLLNTFASGSVPTRIDRKLLWITLRTQVGTLPMRRRAFVELVMPKPYLQQHNLDKIVEHLSALFGRELGSPPKVAMTQVLAMRKFDATPLLPGLAGLPTLVMSSRHDLLAPPSAGRLLAQALLGRYVELPDASHAAPIQCPELVNQHLLEHLGRASGAIG